VFKHSIEALKLKEDGNSLREARKKQINASASRARTGRAGCASAI
jgi:hypothetical protein